MKIQRTGTNLNDPKTYAGAKRIATRKNNDFMKKVRQQTPLFAEEVLSTFEPFTPEKVIERRIIFQARQDEFWKEFDHNNRLKIRQFKREIFELIGRNKTEFKSICRVFKELRGGDRFMRWYRVLGMVKKRLNQPLNEHAELVLAWLSEEENPMTHLELWFKRGDGLSSREILKALMELDSYAYVRNVEVVNIPEQFAKEDLILSKTAWTWETIRK